MDKQHIKEAIELCEQCSSPVTPQWETILDLACSYLKALESGIPEYRRGNGNHGEEQWKTCVCEACFDARTFNEAIDLMIPHIVARDERIKELEKDVEDCDDKIRQLESEVKRLKGER